MAGRIGARERRTCSPNARFSQPAPQALPAALGPRYDGCDTPPIRTAAMTTKHLAAWAATFLVMALIDSLWLGVIAKNLYQQGLGHLMASEPKLGFAALFYLLYPVGLVFFAVLPGAEAASLARTALLGALLGLFAYATYDLTNLSIMKGWPLGLSLLDMAWGTFASGVAATAGGAALRWMGSR